jgi:glucose/mannose transport system substrate-binding protein
MARSVTRRDFFRSAGAVAGAATFGVSALELLEACGNQSTTSTNTSGNLTGNLEIFSWWTGAGEKDGLAMLYQLYNQQHPQVKVVNAAVAGGAGSQAKAVLATRMQANQPPDSFQVHAGQELTATWVKAGKMEPITSIWKDLNLDKSIPADLKSIVSSNGDVWSIPVNVHRGNALWFNLHTLGSATPPTTMDELASSLAAFKAKGIQYPLALGSQGNWQIAMWLENGILANGGVDYYNKLFQGKGSFTDAKVKDTLTQMVQLFAYANPDHTTLDWDGAAGLVAKGTAVYTIMGDWAKGYFTNLTPAMAPNQDFGTVVHPGTKGSYVTVVDTFGLPKGAPHRDNAVAWLKVVASQQGQQDFNPKKGSIPARTDVPTSAFDPISQSFMAEFKSDKLVPSSAHGSATPPNFASAVNDIMGQFAQNKDVNGTASALQAKAQQFLTA